MTEKEILDIFDKFNAFQRGHYKLSSGLHSGGYLQCALVLQHPEVSEKLAKALADRFLSLRTDVVVGPALGGITLAYEVARALGSRGIFAERQEGKMLLRRGFCVTKGENVLVVEDVITTGGSTKEVIDVVKGLGSKIIGVGCIIDRSARPIDFGARFESLAKLEIETFSEDKCPFCKDNIPLTKPGSRQTR